MFSNLQLKAFLFGLIGACFGASIFPLFSVFFPWFENSTEESKPNSSDPAFITSAELEKKIQKLSVEISRVKEFENQLIHKTELLDSVLKQIDALDPSSVESSSIESSSVESLTSEDDVSTETGSGDKVEDELDSVGGGEDEIDDVSDSRARLSSSPSASFVLPKLSSLSSNYRSSRYEKSSYIDNSSYLEESSFLDNYFKFKDMLSGLDQRIELLSDLPLGLPTTGRLTSGFGYRSSPFGGGKRQMHKGLDIAATKNMEVKATAPGIVVKAGRWGGYGKTVMIEHKSGFKTLFGHLDRVTVKEGERVCRGEQIGQLGSTGRSTGPHLHYEIRRNGVHLNPLRFAKFSDFLKL